jgi:SAM-dependent methyltransferase
MSGRRLLAGLTEPEVRNLTGDPDGLAFSMAHRRVLLRKRLLRELFANLYDHVRAVDLAAFGATPGRRIDLGSGSGFVHDRYPDVIASDLKPLPWLQLACDAACLPIRDGTIRTLSGVNVFHHLSDPRAFFREAQRVIRPGGGLILVDIHSGPIARFVTGRLHACEHYDATATSWNAPITGPFSGANQALSYIVFTRDRAQFLDEFPRWDIVSDAPHTGLWWYLSGGVNFRPLVPAWATPTIRTIDRWLSPLNRWIALLHTVTLRLRP